jgi:UDP-GlcNAc:undecaprenyl-phosphate GlcNAc-1-phosphate transferase
MNVVPASIASFLVSCTMLLALRPFAQVAGLIDRPGGRKTHRGEVPVVGGIAMFSGLLVAAAGPPGLAGSSQLLVVAAFMVVLGALDDRFDLPANVRLFAHLSASVALVYSTDYLVHDLGDLVGWRDVVLGPFALPFTVISVVALINAFNMLDGLDGLAGSAGLVALGGIMVIASAGNGSSSTVLVAGSMFGAVAAFLMFNLPTRLNRPVRTFMGDAGSTLLGFVLAGLSLTLVQPAEMDLEPALVLWLMPIPIFELFSSTARRITRGMSPAQADTGHFHHRLVSAGLSVRAICTLYFAVSAASCAFAVWAFRAGVSEPRLVAGFCLVFGGWLLFVRQSPRFVNALPVWFRRTDPTAGH